MVEVIVDDEGRCGTTVYRYDQVLSEERKAVIRSHLPNAAFVTRLRIVPAVIGIDGMPRREMFSEVFDNSMAEVDLGWGVPR